MPYRARMAGFRIQQVQQHNNRFPLTGAHAAVECDSCHKGVSHKPVPDDVDGMLLVPRDRVPKDDRSESRAPPVSRLL